MVAAAILRGDRVLAARRGPTMSLAGLWELPGGKVEVGEDDRSALMREIAEELGMNVTVGEWLGESAHGRICLVAYRCVDDGVEPVLTEHDELRWVFPTDALDWAPADVPLVRALHPAR